MKRARVAVIFLALLTILIYCQINLPIAEMTRARLTITQAYDVKADKYAPELISDAEKRLYASHDLGINDEIDKAKTAALESYKLASDAIEKSLPLYAGDTLSQAKAAYTEAEKLYSERFAPEEFTKAGGLIKESGTQMDNKAFRDSLKTSQNAIIEGETAKEKSMQQIPALKETLEKLVNEKDQLLAMQGKDAGKDELDKADENLKKSGEALPSKDLKVVYQSNTAAAELLAAARNKIVKLNSKDKIAAVRQDINILKKERGAEFAGDDITMAESSLNEAEAFLEQDKSNETAGKIRDAEDSYSKAKMNTKKGIASEKMQSAVQLLEKTRGGEAAKKHIEEIDKASMLIDEGKVLLAASSYDTSMNKADEAGTILNAITIAGEIDQSKTSTITDGEGKENAVYTVQYHRKNTDCLWRIAQKVYKNARLWPLIYIANKNIIRDPDLIFPGQRFQIPPIPKLKALAKENKEVQSSESIEEAKGKSAEMKNTAPKEGEINTIDDTKKKQEAPVSEE